MIHSYESDQLPKYEPCIMKEETKSPYNWAMHTCMLSHFSQVQLFATPWTIARQASLCMGFSSKNIGVGCHFLLQGIFSTQVLNPCLLHLLHWLAGSLSLSPLAIRVILYIRTKTGLRTDGHGFWPQPSRCKWCGFQQYLTLLEFPHLQVEMAYTLHRSTVSINHGACERWLHDGPVMSQSALYEIIIWTSLSKE